MKKFWIVPLIVFLSSCGENIEKEKLIGQYVWNDLRTDTLELNKDGTYHYWRIISGQMRDNSGTWELEYGSQVKFKNFSFLENTYPGNSPGNWFSRLRSQGDEIHLMYASDSNIYFKKIDRPQK